MQLETLGEFGVVLTVMCVALDFSPDKLRKVRGSAIVPYVVHVFFKKADTHYCSIFTCTRIIYIIYCV